MSEFDRRRGIEADGQRVLMIPSKPDLSNMGKSTAYKFGYRQGHADARSAAMELPEVKALMAAMERAIEAIDAAYDGPDDNGAYSLRERAALAAITGGGDE